MSNFTPRELVLAVIAGDIASVREMHAAGVSVVEPDQYGWLPLHRAAANDRDEIIQMLVEWGSPLEATGTNQWTALHLASVSKSYLAVRALVVTGANIHARDEFGRTPLHLSMHRATLERSLEIVRTLLAAGADPSATDHDGETPLDGAREIGHPELRKILGEHVP